MDEPATDVRESTDGASDATTPADVASLVNELRAAKAELEARNEALRLVNDLTFRLQRRLDPEAIAAETAEALKGILSPTAGPFPLACPDPRTGAARGFPARLTACRARAVEAAQGHITLWALDAAFEEVGA